MWLIMISVNDNFQLSITTFYAIVSKNVFRYEFKWCKYFICIFQINNHIISLNLSIYSFLNQLVKFSWKFVKKFIKNSLK